MKKILLSLFFTFAILAALVIPLVSETFAANGIAYFNVSLTTSNSAPTITYVQAGSGSPAEGTTTIVQIAFNASDANGVSDIPAGNAQVSINQSGVTRTSSACVVTGTSGTTNAYLCNITINYYDLPGAWTTNASVFDGAGATASNTTVTFTMGTTYGISLSTNTLTFSGSAGQNDVAASNNPQTVNNTGNGAFSGMNVTAFDLLSGGSNYIGAGNFSANISNSAVGHALSNNTMVTIASSNLSVLATTTLYVYVDVPTGISNGTYTSTNSWIVTMIQS